MSSCASCRQCTKIPRVTQHSASDLQRAREEQGTKPKGREHFHTSAFSHFKPSKPPAWTQTLKLLSSISLLSAWFSPYTQSVSLMYDPLATNVDDGTIPSCWEQDFHGLPDLDSTGDTRVLAAAAAPLDVLFERDFWPGTDHKPAAPGRAEAFKYTELLHGWLLQRLSRRKPSSRTNSSPIRLRPSTLNFMRLTSWLLAKSIPSSNLQARSSCPDCSQRYVSSSVCASRSIQDVLWLTLVCDCTLVPRCRW